MNQVPDRQNDAKERMDSAPIGTSSGVVLGAGIGMILGAALGNAGVGMVLGAACGLVSATAIGRKRRRQ